MKEEESLNTECALYITYTEYQNRVCFTYNLYRVSKTECALYIMYTEYQKQISLVHKFRFVRIIIIHVKYIISKK